MIIPTKGNNDGARDAVSHNHSEDTHHPGISSSKLEFISLMLKNKTEFLSVHEKKKNSEDFLLVVFSDNHFTLTSAFRCLTCIALPFLACLTYPFDIPAFSG